MEGVQVKELYTVGKCHALPLLTEDDKCSLVRLNKKPFYKLVYFLPSDKGGGGGGGVKKTASTQKNHVEKVFLGDPQRLFP